MQKKLFKIKTIYKGRKISPSEHNIVAENAEQAVLKLKSMEKFLDTEIVDEIIVLGHIDME